MDSYIITDGMGEFVAHYNTTNHIMHFTKNREEAMRTNDSQYAYDIAKIAQSLYKRKHMRMSMI